MRKPHSQLSLYHPSLSSVLPPPNLHYPLLFDLHWYGASMKSPGRDGLWKGEERRHHFDCRCAGQGCSFSSVKPRRWAHLWKRVSAAPWGMLAISAEWDVRREAGEGKAEAAAGPWIPSVLLYRFLHSLPQQRATMVSLLSWLVEAAPGDAQSHVGGREDGVSVCVCEGLARSRL